MKHGISRRDLFKTGAAAAATLAIPGLARAQSDRPIRYAIVGVGGMGTGNRRNAARLGSIVALCDIDHTRTAEASGEHPGAALFSDWKAMMDSMGDEIDAVVISTPDHTHFNPAIEAVRQGKHVYVEKPLCRTIAETRALTQEAERTGVVTQMGNQGTSNADLRRAAAALRDGLVGDVREIHCWTDRAGGYWVQGVNRPEPQPTPWNVAWDLWLGDAPYRPYAPGYHPFAWRGWWDFGTGALGDMGCHVLNLPFVAFDLVDPLEATAETSGHEGDSFPSWSKVVYRFGKTSDRDELPVYWYDGGQKPAANLAPGIEFGGNGILIVGSTGTLYSASAYGSGAIVLRGDRQESVPDVPFVPSAGHWDDFHAAILGGDRPASDFVTSAGPLTEMVLFGNDAVRTGSVKR